MEGDHFKSYIGYWDFTIKERLEKDEQNSKNEAILLLVSHPQKELYQIQA